VKAVVTGANGFVGSAVVRQLLDTDHEVRALVREKSNRRSIEGLPIEICIGDIRDQSSLTRAMSGCQALFHVAADYRLWVPNPDEMYETNVNGSRNVMLAAAEAGVERIVYTSSVATLGLNAGGEPANEQTRATLDDMIGPYKRSKYLAEAEVRRLANELELPVVIVNPSTPVGPRDIRPTPTGQMILQAARGRMPAYVDTGLNLVHVDDVARGHLQALERGAIGQCYILGGKDMMLKEILGYISSITGRRPPAIKLPHNLVLPFAWLAEQFGRFLHKRDLLLTVDGVRMAKKRMFFSSEKAKRELGYKPRPAREALHDAVQWFQINGYCNPD